MDGKTLDDRQGIEYLHGKLNTSIVVSKRQALLI
jgi:hypothetical protein